MLESLCIITDRDLSKLISMLYLDIGKYGFEKSEEGIWIEFYEENPKTLTHFAERFSEWLAEEIFLFRGDQFFAKHPHRSLWVEWRENHVFVDSYCDQVFRALVRKSFLEFLYELEAVEFFNAMVELSELLRMVEWAVEIRIHLVEKHFVNNEHEWHLYQYQKKKEVEKNS